MTPLQTAHIKGAAAKPVASLSLSIVAVEEPAQRDCDTRVFRTLHEAEQGVPRATEAVTGAPRTHLPGSAASLALAAGPRRSGSPLPSPRAARIGVRRPRLTLEPPLALDPFPFGPTLTPGSHPSLASRVLPSHEPSSSPSHRRYARSVDASRSPGLQAVTASGRPAGKEDGLASMISCDREGTRSGP